MRVEGTATAGKNSNIFYKTYCGLLVKNLDETEWVEGTATAGRNSNIFYKTYCGLFVKNLSGWEWRDLLQQMKM